MSEFKYLQDEAWLESVVIGKAPLTKNINENRDAILVEIVYQLKRIGDLLEEKFEK